MALQAACHARATFSTEAQTGTLFQWPLQTYGHFHWVVQVQFVKRVRFVSVCGTRHQSPLLTEQVLSDCTSLGRPAYSGGGCFSCTLTCISYLPGPDAASLQSHWTFYVTLSVPFLLTHLSSSHFISFINHCPVAKDHQPISSLCAHFLECSK